MKCRKCRKETSFKSFAIFRTRSGEIRKRGICKDCRGEYAFKNFKRLKEWRKNYNIKNRTKKRERDFQLKLSARRFVDKIKESKPCKDCKKYFKAVCMDFDHIKGKNRGISSMCSQGYKINLIAEEIKLCELVCSNCHRIRTQKRKDNWGGNQLSRHKKVIIKFCK